MSSLKLFVHKKTPVGGQVSAFATTKFNYSHFCA